MADSPSSRSSLEGSKVMVVGAGSPLGLAIAVALLQAGARVILVDSKNLELPAGLRGAPGVRFENCDITNEQSVLSLVQRVGCEISGLVYLPRIRVRKPFGEVSLKDLIEDTAVTVGGLILVAQALTHTFQDRFRNQPETNSFIISISSVLGSRVSGAEGITYHATKAAQEQAIRYLAVELGPWGVRANSVAPGWISKERTLSVGTTVDKCVDRAHALMRTGDVADVVDAVLFLASRSASFVTGQVLYLDGGASLKEAGSLAQDIRKLICDHEHD